MTSQIHETFGRSKTQPVFGIVFDQETAEELADVIACQPTPGQRVRLVVTANVDHIALLRQNRQLREAYRHSWRRTIDGTPVWLYARLRRAGISQRVTGADLFPLVLARMLPKRDRLFLVVASDMIGERMTAWARKAGFSADAVLVEVPPFGFESDEEYGKALSTRIRDNSTTHLFFGVGCPRSECWIDRHRDQLGDVYAMAVGAGIGFFVGMQKRAPAFTRKYGMEWMWRLMQEPRRLGFRYIVRSWAFLAAVVSDLSGKGVGV